MDGSNTEGDGLKWFGEGFDGFPKRLPEECVEYAIYVIDSKLKDIAATRMRLNQILKVANELCKKHTKDYIWQRDSLELKLKPDLLDQDASQASKAHPQPLHLKGRTNFGDSVADEWLVVYILLELSKLCSDVWIRVYDTDGEFLLIEAANALPKWLNPDIAENRVWINNGHLRLIPIDAGAGERNLALMPSLKFIESSADKLVISPFVEDEAFHRLRDYPAAILSSLHNALVRIPRRVAYLLHRNPAHISPAIEAFYLRDPVGLRPLATKDISNLTFPPEDFVTVSVKFTKVGYAQLRSQLFDTPPAWTGVIPRLGDMKVELGMKITCGFEMLLNDRQRQNDRMVREVKVFMDDLEDDGEALPSHDEIGGWPQQQDDEKWLDIDYNDFEDELAGKNASKRTGKGQGFGDKGAQENLRKMVSRFEDFLNDDDAGAEGVDDNGADDDDTDSDSSASDSGEDKDGSFDEAEFERAMKEMMGMPADEIEKNGLLEEARRLALEDEKAGEEPDEDEEMKKVMEMMEKELKGHGALKLNPDKSKSSAKSVKKNGDASKKVAFGPERPPGMDVVAGKEASIQDDDEDVGPGDGELSSDDEDFNDVDLGLAKNMLEAFKGQAGMAGPAGNLMKVLGVNMPRDEEGL
ncbi:hypothetical protein LTR78_002732 [Recurvomyces mirabilis]|uniref:Uncharacterized protein n=1 Tax=Recurvomyces mirabilis TaxID=574656 RepID=A0AAE0WSD9_9PEZI|nr:hypothetical protein LTR78_002732 [Recurvomyces mirabilis]KAK5159533.1 hypothetical protein LTS14_002675 [Recurvomyces mirabilis]